MRRKESAKRSKPDRWPSPWPWLGLAVAIAAVGAGLSWLNTDPPPKTDANPATAQVVVYKTPSCQCCSRWADHLRADDLEVAEVTVSDTRPLQAEAGLPGVLRSCHTARVGDYWVEGHVPSDLVRQLLTERPEGIVGLSVPGMPIGSPGMEGPNPVTYDVIAYDAAGRMHVFTTRQGSDPP